MDLVEIVFKVEDVVETMYRFDLSFSDEYGCFLGVVYRPNERLSSALRGYDLRHRGYVQAVGKLKAFGGTSALVLMKLAAIHDYTEVVNHRLRVIWSHKQRHQLAAGKAILRERNNGEGNTRGEIVRVVRKLNPFRNRRGVHRSAILSQMEGRLTPKELETKLNELVAAGDLGVGEEAGCFLINSP